MQKRWQSWLGMFALGVVMGVAHIWQRDHSGSLLASVVGDYQSHVRYVVHDDVLTISGVQGGEDSLDVMVMYDAGLVDLISVSSNYEYVVQDDEQSLIRVSLQGLPSKWNDFPLVDMQWEGSMDAVVVSDIGVRSPDGSFRTLSLSVDSSCLSGHCHHE